MKFPIILISCLLLAACSQVQVSDGQRAESWRYRQQQLRQIDNWVATGRVAITTRDDGWNGTLHWKQFTEGYEIKIIAPFGKGTVMLKGNSAGVTLYPDDEPPEYSDNATSLLAKRLGWHVPVESLRYWMLGLPDPDSNQRDFVIELDDSGRLSGLVQSGWQVRFLRYQQVNGDELPDKIFLENDKLSVRVVIQNWKLSI
ncbi:MAG: outer membrane lipoprotein LolB [Gammaproteobacteria bacterium]|nr:outer membrane lipoprotein LolB [Gammaproteobacteria bacterium]